MASSAWDRPSNSRIRAARRTCLDFDGDADHFVFVAMQQNPVAATSGVEFQMRSPAMAKSRTKPTLLQGGKAKSVDSAELPVAPTVVHPAQPDRVVAELEGDFAAANLAAVAQANTALIEGFEAIGEAVYAYARDSFSSAASAARSLIEARNLVDVVALNGEFAKTALEG